MADRFKPVKLKIINTAPGKISTGFNTEVLIDGKSFPGITFLKLEIKPKNATKVIMEFVADVELEQEIEKISKREKIK